MAASVRDPGKADAAGTNPGIPEGQTVMGKYVMLMGADDVVGEGTSSICRKGVDMQGHELAIKVYKKKRGDDKNAGKVRLVKFRRQVEVLKELMEPFKEPENPALWDSQLNGTPPETLFMKLVDYSKDESGEPGPDPADGVMYVVTELASYSLKDYIKMRRDQEKPLSKGTIKTIAKAMILVTAGLHAKGLVHLDLKPENLMVFNGVLKLIDVDGCVKLNSKISISDSSLSFSPCYCAPEWAAFLIEDSENPTILAGQGLDVWSIGITIAELVSLDAILMPTYASFMRHGRSHREAGFLFMEWLSHIQKSPLPKSVAKFDPELLDMLTTCLLVVDYKKRKTCAETLKHKFCGSGVEAMKRASTGPLTAGEEEGQTHGEALPQEAPRHHKQRPEDTSSAVRFKGTLWKLNVDGDAADASNWLLRDMWINDVGSLCYYSQREGKRLVLFDAQHFCKSNISNLKSPSAKDYAFRVEMQDDHETSITVFAAESGEDYGKWMGQLERLKLESMQTMCLGSKFFKEFSSFKLQVRNRRMKVDSNKESGAYEPTFKDKLWKVKSEGSPMIQQDWFDRDMWISKNGALVYLSKKEEKELVYFTPTDIAQAKVTEIPEAESCRKWSFQVVVPPTPEGLEFAPGLFAAESMEKRKAWMDAFKQFAKE
mmetsp:Transcript_36456/g.83754  ORF Transcript_36456/g.83754 Transcript_36456/m.83754 type:complete len:657 (-) Transcript_36456:226-2196(-)